MSLGGLDACRASVLHQHNPGSRFGLCRGGDRHLQQAVVFALAGRAVAVLGGSLDELDAHFVLLELDQKPGRIQRPRGVRKGHPGRGTMKNTLVSSLEYSDLDLTDWDF